MKIKIPDDVRAERLFNKYRRLALSAAKKVAGMYKRSYQELADESLSILARLVTEQWEGFDSSKSSACSWIYRKVFFNLQNYCIALSKRHRREGTRIIPSTDDWDAQPTSGVPEPAHRGRSRIESLMAEVGEEGRALLKVIFTAPGDLALMLSPEAPVRSVNALRQYLENRWSQAKVRRAWEQVEFSLTHS